jgi:hypothetical protein
MTMRHVRADGTPRLFTLAVLVLGIFAAVSFAAPPRVIRATPDNDERTVDPNVRSIRVEFDQDMAEGSHSWVGGGSAFPKLRGRPYWEGPRVAVLPVELVPDHEYALSVNNPSFGNFRNATGQSAEPYPIEFRTGVARPAADPKEVAAAENKGSVAVLRRAIDRYYSYRDLRKVDWDAVFARFTPRLEQAATAEAFAKVAGELLAEAGDIHITLELGAERFASHKRAIPPNVNIDTLRKLVPNWEKRSKRVVSGRFEDGIGYILIATWEREYADDIEAAYAALDDLHDTKALIVDVRFNAGGDEGLAQKFAGCFVDRPVVYSKHVYRAPDVPGGFSEPEGRVLQPTKGRPKYRGKVAVLMGPVNMSSCESFLLMMRQVPGCKLVGATSYGGSGNPQGYGLPNGVVVYLPSWKDMTPEGAMFEGQGLAPDKAVKTETKDSEERDPVLDAALHLLRD